MSLINKMLKDLDQRNPPSDKPNEEKSLLSGLKPSIPLGKQWQKPVLILVLLILLIVLIGVTLITYSRYQKHKTLRSQPEISTKVTTLQQKNLIADNKTNQKKSSLLNKSLEKQASDELQTITEEITLNNFSLDSGSDIAYLHLSLTKTTHYFIENNNSDQPILLTLANTKLTPALQSNLQELPANKWIKNIKFHQVTDALVIEINLMPNIELSKLQSKNEPSSEILMHFIQKNNADTDINIQTAALDSGTMHKITLPLTDEEIVEQEYQQAIELAFTNQTPAAIAKLQKVLNVSPKYTQAREALVSLLIKYNKPEQALKVVSDGLAKDPENLVFIKLQAQILVNQGRLEQALKTLSKHHPAINLEPDYYGFTASLYQKTKQYIMAAKIYDQLTKLQPNKAMWWIGLGISLEAVGENNASVEAYKNALRNGANLDPQVRAYIESKF